MPTPPAPLAPYARSILSCPSVVELVVDGAPDVLAGEEPLGMQDVDGTPVFSCRPDSELARASTVRAAALVTVRSGLGRDGDDRLGDVLTLAGRLRTTGREDCACCGEIREVVTLDLEQVVLGAVGPVALEQFRSPVHRLNPGFLRRSVEHANDCHQDELRSAIASTTGTRLGDVVGVHLAGLTPRGVDLAWVDVTGAHETRLVFSRPARTTGELGELLRSELHAGLC